MNLSDKIKQILVDKAISPSIFADEIGIQRSSMSHILAGRNKPSLEMVQKIVKRFPDLGLDWILDENELPDTSEQPPMPNVKSKQVSALLKKEPREITEPKLEKVRAVAKIVVFYTDGTFKEFAEI